MYLKKFSVLFLLLLVISCQQQTDTVPQVEYFAQEGSSDLPFSKAVRVDDMLYLSGELGTDPETGELPEGGIKAETEQALKNIKNTLEKYGSSLDNVIKVTVMLADINEWADMNSVYITFFPNNKPARSAFGTSGLAMNARLEMECIAVIK